MEDARARERLTASGGVALLHLLLAYALVAGLNVRFVLPHSDDLKLFDVAVPPPPPEATAVAKAEPKAAGAAAPPSREARPTPVVAPPPRLPLPSHLRTAPEPRLPTGTDATAGAAHVDGPGTGAGGVGAGAGSGGRGSGTGGGAAVPAERISGRLSGDTDYPASARRAGVEGSVSVRFVVRTDGRVGGCRVTRSSGHAELDSTTCRLIEERFRYRPARDADGRPVPQTVTRTFDWLLPYRH
ncbi:MAG TPA: energy transducer TonB [Allosphingosinicella sp.]|jgi:protein TonB|nr:energy transducer TonB [Allosphingosinicella sp.]